jgi:hypothetical protein
MLIVAPYILGMIVQRYLLIFRAGSLSLGG